jgi:protein CSF1
MFKGLLSGMDQSIPAPVELQSQASPLFPKDIDLQASVRLVNVSLHIMHGTWLSWTLYRIMLFGKTPDLQTIAGGVEIPAQIIVLSAKPDGLESAITEADSSVKLELPSFRVSGILQYSTVQATIAIDKFKLMLKPQYMDDILVVQQKFGQDFNDLVDIFTQTTRKTPSKAPSTPFVYKISGKLDGFSIGIQGPTCIQYLDSPLIRGRIGSTNPSRLQWRIEVNNLALSLVHDTSVGRTRFTDREQYRSAYMVMDCLVHNESPQEVVGLQEMRHLTVSVDKIHALMMPAAVAELGNLVDYVQVGPYLLSS